MATTIKLKQDYYGTKDYGKRAFYKLDADGNYSFDIVFIEDLEEWIDWKRSEGKSLEIEYADGNLRIYDAKSNKVMKLFKGMTKKGEYFTELIKIEDFTTIEDCLKIINDYFLEDDDDCLYETDDIEEKDYKYAYISQDGSVTFVESLDEFSESRKTEEAWDVDFWTSLN